MVPLLYVYESLSLVDISMVRVEVVVFSSLLIPFLKLMAAEKKRKVISSTAAMFHD